MNHKEATEKFFRLRGWEDQGTHWSKPNGEDHVVWVCDDKGFGASGHSYKKPLPLPNICESMTDWIKYVQKEMPNKGEFSILAGCWYWWLDSENHNINTYEEIKDHEILLASVRAACDYLEEKGVNDD
jgi:hypothetical protein